LIASAFVSVRFTMLLRGPGADDAGRAFVRAHRRTDKPSSYPPDLLLLDADGALVARLDYGASAEETLAVLATVAGGRAHEEPVDDEAGGMLARGEALFREGDFEAAAACFRRVVAEHGDHPLRHRAAYHLMDPHAWPTRLHPAIADGPMPDPERLRPFAARRAAQLRALAGDARYRKLPNGLVMVWVTPGTFTMGSNDPMLRCEAPGRRVTLTGGFWMSAWPVTEAVYDGGQDAFPATEVDFGAARRFCERVGRELGIELRLPSEAEWEHAARGGLDGAPYPWGHAAIDPDRCNYALPCPCAVASYPPNGFGLFDMVGNVQEWTQDHYRHDAYSMTAEAVVDPSGPDSCDDGLALRAVRGGLSGGAVCQLMCRNAFRIGLTEAYAGGSIGLRVVADAI
jgi:formylglycine-generating enzyme required for sulfatase activity